MISAYDDWYVRKNWYALLVVICTNKGVGRALLDLDCYEKEKPKEHKPRKVHYKYDEELVERAMNLRFIDGMKWHDIADEVGINYGSLMSIYSKRKRQGLIVDNRKGVNGD